MRQILTCAPRSSNTDMSTANPNDAPNCAVNTAVWVRNPGPMAEVAIRSAAPARVDRLARARVGISLTQGGSGPRP